MRSLVSIFLLFLMLFQAAGYLFIFAIQQHEIREEIKRQIKAGVPEAELVLFKIPRTLEEKPNSVFQHLHEREFRYGGNMYDVIRQETHGDTTWYYCLADEKETQLFANLDELVKRETNQNTERKAQMERLLGLLGAWFLNPRHHVPRFFSAGEVASTNYLFSVKIWIDTPPTPPPEA